MESVVKNNLPLPKTTFIGRHHEIDEIVSLLTDSRCRLLTLVGPGGIGKTRLALESAHHTLDAFANGVYFVSLAPLEEPSDIVLAIIDALPFQLPDVRCDPSEQLLDYLRDKHLLLVLDNFEHLLAGVDIVSAILEGAPQVKVMVTSREALNLQDEWIRSLTGMAYPDNGHNGNLESYSAVQLFIERALRLRGDFSPNEDSRSIARICQLVEGVPLAIELAAGWIKTLSPADIATEIERGLDILVTRSRDMSQRHQSMRAVFDHSWRLLTPEERAVFQRLSVFRGGFTREVAVEITNASLHTLASLVDKSLLVLGDTARYEVHELLRQFGAEQLELAGEAEAIHAAHTAYFMSRLNILETDIKAHRQIEALDEIEAGFENIRSAWYRAVKQQNYDALNQALESLNLFSDMRGRFNEGDQMFRFAIDQLGADVPAGHELTLARLKMRHMRLILMGAMDYDFDLAEQTRVCMDIALAHHDPAETGYAYHLMGILTLGVKPDGYVAAYHAATELFNQSLVYFRQINDRFYIGETLAWSGASGIGLPGSNHERDMGLIQQGLEIRRELDEKNGIAWSLFNLAEGMLSLYRFDEAEYYLRLALDGMRAIGTVKGITLNSYRLCHTLVLKGDVEEAQAILEEIATVAKDTYLDGDLQLDGLRALLISIIEEDYDKAHRLAERARDVPARPFHGYKTYSVYWGIMTAACGQGDYATVRIKQPHIYWIRYDDPASGTICLATEAAALADEGDKVRAVELLSLAFSLPDSVTGWLKRWPLITRLQARLEADLGHSAFLAAWKRGAASDLETEIRRIIGDTKLNTRQQANQALLDPLTDRELEVLDLVAAGLSNRDIAERLVVSVGTVKVHIRHIYNKLDVSSRTQAIAQASGLNLI